MATAQMGEFPTKGHPVPASRVERLRGEADARFAVAGHISVRPHQALAQASWSMRQGMRPRGWRRMDRRYGVAIDGAPGLIFESLETVIVSS